MKKYPKWLIAEYVDQINRELFNGVLPIEELTFRQYEYDEHYSAVYFDYNIDLYINWQRSTDELFATLAHEMVHYFQDLLDIPTNHNGKFFRYYADKFVKVYGEKKHLFTGV